MPTAPTPAALPTKWRRGGGGRGGAARGAPGAGREAEGGCLRLPQGTRGLAGTVPAPFLPFPSFSFHFISFHLPLLMPVPMRAVPWERSAVPCPLLWREPRCGTPERVPEQRAGGSVASSPALRARRLGVSFRRVAVGAKLLSSPLPELSLRQEASAKGRLSGQQPQGP